MIRILCITPLNSIPEVKNDLNKLGSVDYLNDPDVEEVSKIIQEYEVIFTNPNKSKVYLGRDLLDKAVKLKCITTASTGTIHIDMDYAKSKNIKVLNLSKEIPILETISSTAEHAFLLTLAGIRNFFPAVEATIQGAWDYEPYIGRQMNKLKVGVLGYGRLGKMYASYAKSFLSEVKIYDPFVDCTDFKQNKDLGEFLKDLDILSIHIHASKSNIRFLNSEFFTKCKNGLLIVNTSRGEIVDEDALLKYLDENDKSKYYTDVLSDETRDTMKNKILLRSLEDPSILVTPHMGGMTMDAQKIAYSHAVSLLNKFLSDRLL